MKPIPVDKELELQFEKEAEAKKGKGERGEEGGGTKINVASSLHSVSITLQSYRHIRVPIICMNPCWNYSPNCSSPLI